MTTPMADVVESAGWREMLEGFGQTNFREGSRADYVTASQWEDYVEVPLSVLEKIRARLSQAGAGGGVVDEALIRNLVGLAILDGENLGRYAKDREPAETNALREVSLNGRTTQILAAFAPSPSAGEERPILAEYTNWRGERSIRTFIPRRVFWGSNEWHPEPQVLIEAYDCEKEALRTFAAAGFATPPATPVQPTASVEAVAQIIAREMMKSRQHDNATRAEMAARAVLASLTAPTQGDGGDETPASSIPPRQPRG